MISRKLRRVLSDLGLAALPLTFGGCAEVTDHRILVDRDHPYYAAAIAACATDEAACARLCDDLAVGLDAYDGSLSEVTGCAVTDEGGGLVAVELELTTEPEACGRRPDGLRPARARGATLVAAWLASSARLEAASVHAFARLARELAAHAAPARLVRLALRAAADEVRHATVMRRLARARGATMPAVELAPVPRPTLEALAVENAVEGGVREAFGVVLAHHQARTAGDHEIAAALTSIARDETEHAALAAAVATWATTRLDAAARARIEAARRHALHELPTRTRAMAATLTTSARRQLGLPDPAAAATLARAFTHAVA